MPNKKENVLLSCSHDGTGMCIMYKDCLIIVGKVSQSFQYFPMFSCFKRCELQLALIMTIHLRNAAFYVIHVISKMLFHAVEKSSDHAQVATCRCCDYI